MNACSSSAGQGSPAARLWSPRIVASTVAACSPPITDVRAFGHWNSSRGEYARPHIA